MTGIRFGIIADDFTGAMDTGAQFAGEGAPVRVSLDGQAAEEDAVVVLTTDSREINAQAAAERAAQAASALRGRRLFKKIDSTLRGHVGAETLAVLAACGADKAVLCSAVPGIGRVIRAGQLYINGQPLHETSFGADPGWPARSADVAERIGGGAQALGLDVVRGEVLAQAVWASPARLLAADAESEADLARLADLLRDPRLLACGALALGRAWRAVFGDAPAPARAPRLSHGPYLLACGSSNPAARVLAQDVARETGAVTLVVAPGRDLPVAAARNALKSRLPVLLQLQLSGAQPVAGGLANGPALMAETVRQVCAQALPAGLILMGGETARSTLHALEAGAVWVHGELAPGLAWGRLAGGLADRRWLVTQSGGLSAAASVHALTGCLLDFCE